MPLKTERRISKQLTHLYCERIIVYLVGKRKLHQVPECTLRDLIRKEGTSKTVPRRHRAEVSSLVLEDAFNVIKKLERPGTCPNHPPLCRKLPHQLSTRF
jgi:hypothetical protein